MNGGNVTHKEWLQKALEDEVAGRDILDRRHFAAPACFHFQQMAEKVLKALLTYHDAAFPKIHDLITLAVLIERLAPDIRSYKSDLEFLNRYYVETRYPGDYPEFTFGECEEAAEAALRIKEFVCAYIANADERHEGFGMTAVIIIIAAVALLGGGFWYARTMRRAEPEKPVQNQQPAVPSSASASKTPPAEIDTSTWKTYRNEKYGFEVKYPEGWELDINDSRSMQFKSTAGSKISVFTGGYHVGDVDVSSCTNRNFFTRWLYGKTGGV